MCTCRLMQAHVVQPFEWSLIVMHVIYIGPVNDQLSIINGEIKTNTKGPIMPNLNLNSIYDPLINTAEE